MLPHPPLKLAPRADKRGFTLIELSIVLVIIGLVIGGILFGQDLIKQAEIRAQISQFQQFTTAFNAFKTKYNCIPGDCGQATSFGLGTVGGYGDNGDDNGQIYCNPAGLTGGNWPSNKEQMNAWKHLSAAGMIPGTFLGMPTPSARVSQSDGYWPPGKIPNMFLHFQLPIVVCRPVMQILVMYLFWLLQWYISRIVTSMVGAKF